MRILFIGGTRFVGLAMVQCALARGHRVDVFHRGSSPTVADLTGARHILGDRNADLSALGAGDWDAVVDVCAYRPHEVVRLAAVLGSRVGLSVLISSQAVYAADAVPPCTESTAVADTLVLDGQDLATVAIDAVSYGPLKVLCEHALMGGGARHLIVRPPYVIGPHDYTQRFPEWVRRIAAGGEVSAPGPRDAPMSYIDARDLAAFVILCIEQGTTGVLNTAATSLPFTFEDFLDATVQAVGPTGTRLRWLAPSEAKASGLAFPLWGSGRHDARLAVDSSAAVALGLRCRPLQACARDVLQWTR